MSDFLDHLAAKAVSPQPAVRPLIRTPFEPASAEKFTDHVDSLETPAPVQFPTWQHPPVVEIQPPQGAPPSIPAPPLETLDSPETPSRPLSQAAPDEPGPTALPSQTSTPSIDPPTLQPRETAPVKQPPCLSPNPPAVSLVVPVVTNPANHPEKSHPQAPPPAPLDAVVPSISVRTAALPFPAAKPELKNAPPPPRPPPPPQVTITQGRVEIRAAAPPSAAPTGSQPAGPPLSLETYLRQSATRSA